MRHYRMFTIAVALLGAAVAILAWTNANSMRPRVAESNGSVPIDGASESISLAAPRADRSNIAAPADAGTHESASSSGTDNSDGRMGDTLVVSSGGKEISLFTSSGPVSVGGFYDNAASPGGAATSASDGGSAARGNPMGGGGTLGFDGGSAARGSASAGGGPGGRSAAPAWNTGPATTPARPAPGRPAVNLAPGSRPAAPASGSSAPAASPLGAPAPPTPQAPPTPSTPPIAVASTPSVPSTMGTPRPMIALGPIIDTDTGGDGMPGHDVILPGTFSPGHSPGTAAFGSLTLVDTTYLIMEIAGRDVGEFDRITTTGELVFAGTLDIRLLGGFMPIDGDAFDLFDWGSVRGQFSDILLPTLVPRLAWDLSRLYVDGTIEVGDSPVMAFATDTAAVPSPSALMFVGVGLVALAMLHARRSIRRTSRNAVVFQPCLRRSSSQP